MPSTLVRKKGARGPENRNRAAACTTASIAGNDRGAPLSRSASTGDAPSAFSLSCDDADRGSDIALKAPVALRRSANDKRGGDDARPFGVI